ncbi:hypothetical protein MANES_02G227400v8 [Manihot esculenta]|uniref:Uncharacterized protein n=1 Tax=Manihot esculenta TaxID=3983 RepID=A0ACB7I8S8_MANES|nr:hypothetical protein MANES_02G227400v8 [Manihot esculenta]
MKLDPSGTVGGLCFTWKSIMNDTLVKYSSFFIHANIFFYQSKQVSWLMERIAQLDFLLKYKQHLSVAILFKSGDNAISSSQGFKLRNLINTGGLVVLRFRGLVFTWNNRRDSHQNIQKKIDRSLASYHWLSLYPSASVEHLEDRGLDHHPVLISMVLSHPKAKRQLHFDERWISILETSLTIEGAWNTTSRLENAKNTPSWDGEVVRSVERELSNEIKEEEQYWEQKARMNWLKSRD